MPFIPVPNTVLAEVVCFLEDQVCENTLYFNKPSGWDAGAMQALGEELISWWGTNMAPLLSPNVVLKEVQVTDLSSDSAPSVLVVPAVATQGTASSAPGPNNVAFVLKFSTAGRGRSSRGRNYIYGFGEADVSVSRMNSVLANQLVTAYGELTGVADNSTATWVVVSRRHNKVDRAEGISQPVVAVSYTDLVTDSQRRRLPGRGK